MGLTKRLLEEQQARGYRLSNGRYVCRSCVTDHSLSAILEAASEEMSCSYCESKKAANLSVLIDEIMDAIREDYDDPADELPYDGKEGGWQGTVYDNWEILDELDDWTDCEDLRTDVADALSDREWCKKHYFELDKFEILDFGWETFKQQIIHRTRFLFMVSDRESRHEDRGSIRPARMLARLGELFRYYDMFHKARTGTAFVRARVTERGERPTTAKELGTLAPNDARFPNRMSPAGIPMFYAAINKKTAIAETFDTDRGNPNELEITLGTFRSSMALLLLDLVNLPPLPSCFDRDKKNTIKPLRFLWSLRKELTKPINKDGREHIEYVPTQVITEYVRHQLKYGNKKSQQVDGIIYPSTKDIGGTSVVIFADSENCGPSMDRKSFRSSRSSKRPGSEEVFLHLEHIERVYPTIEFRSDEVGELVSALSDG